MKKSTHLLIPLTLLAASLVLPGCLGGYSGRSLHRSGIRSVALPIWTRGKNVYERDLEMRVTEAIAKQIQLDTDYVIAKERSADTRLTGSIDNILKSELSYDPDSGVPRELQTTITISFVWEDLRSGKIIKERKNIQVATTYIPAPPYGETFFQGGEDLANRIAIRVVESMESDW